MSEIYQVADAVVAAINDANFPNGSLTARRVYVPIVDLKDLLDQNAGDYSGPTILVTPHADDINILDRDRNNEEIKVGIGFMQKIQPGTKPDRALSNADIDPLVSTMRQIALLFGPWNSYAGDGAWIETKYLPIYDVERLRKRVFMSLVVLTFRQGVYQGGSVTPP